MKSKFNPVTVWISAWTFAFLTFPLLESYITWFGNWTGPHINWYLNTLVVSVLGITMLIAAFSWIFILFLGPLWYFFWWNDKRSL